MGRTFYITVFMSAVALVSSRPERLAVEKDCTTSVKMDVQLIIDSSSSVLPTGFKKMTKSIAEKVLPIFNIGPEATRVAVFKYSQEHVMVNEFGLNKFSDLPSMQRAVEDLVFEYGQTYTAMAMHEALKTYQEEARSDPGIAKVCIVLTDGVANDASDIPAAQKAWADAGVNVFAVGISTFITQSALEDISGSSDRVLRATDFDTIGEVTKSLLGEVCKAIKESGWTVESSPKPLDVCTGDSCKCPNGLVGVQPFCFPTDAVCCETPGCSKYRGIKNTTASGRDCQPWNSDEPHIRNKETKANMESAGLSANYCRNPTKGLTAWCYTMDEDERWEYCDIPKCSDMCGSQPCEHGTCIDGACTVQRKLKCARFQEGNKVSYETVEQCSSRIPGEKCEIKLQEKCPKMPGKIVDGRSYESGIEVGCEENSCWRRAHNHNYNYGAWGYVVDGNSNYISCTDDIDCRFMEVSDKTILLWKGK